MVDLSTVKMPVVEYSDGSKEPLEHFYRSSDDGDYCVNGKFFESNGDTYRGGATIVAIHAADQAADGWVRTEHAAMKQFDDCNIAVNVKSRHWSSCGELPTWLLWSTAYTTAEIDAAYAAHVAAKPVLVWDETLAFLKRSRHGDGEYFVRYVGHCEYLAELHTPTRQQGCGLYRDEKEAKAACERHAKGE